MGILLLCFTTHSGVKIRDLLLFATVILYIIVSTYLPFFNKEKWQIIECNEICVRYDYDMLHLHTTWCLNTCLYVSERPSKTLPGSVPADPLWSPLLRKRRLNVKKALSLTRLNAPLTHQTALTKWRYIALWSTRAKYFQISQIFANKASL